MPQDRESGAAAAKWGLQTARRLAIALAATDLRANSNQCSIQNRRVALKTAREKTTKVGVTYAMLDRVEEVLGAWEVGPDRFEIWALSAKAFKRLMEPSHSRGPSAGKIGLVSKRDFQAEGELRTTVRLPGAPPTAATERQERQ